MFVRLWVFVWTCVDLAAGKRPVADAQGVWAHLIRRVRSGVFGCILCPHIESCCFAEEHEALEAADGREVAGEGVEAGEGGDVLMDVKS